MNGRKMYREYAQSKGKEAVEFIRIQSGSYGESDFLVTRDSKRNLEETTIDYRDVVHWLIRTKKIQE